MRERRNNARRGIVGIFGNEKGSRSWNELHLSQWSSFFQDNLVSQVYSKFDQNHII